MNKIFIKKLFIALFIITILLSFLNNCMSATNNTVIVDEPVAESTFETLHTQNEKIIEYDIETGKTTEVDMDELKQKLTIQYNIKGYGSNSTNSYDPYKCTYLSNDITTYSSYTRVTNVSEFPYRVTCRLLFDVYGDVGVGTGFLVGPNSLLTSAHCVLNRYDSDKAFADWVAFPGYNNGPYNGISSAWSKIYYPEKWTLTHAPEYDWCLCLLKNNIGSQVGWYGCQAYGTNSEMNNISVKALGYSNSLGEGRYQFYSTGNLFNTHDRYFQSYANVTGGMSGGPFIRTSDNYAIGIIKGYDETDIAKSYGVRITQQIIDLINSLNS
ncbi:MAG: trypsin-like serine protease [Clostridia bacterium]|nr:trypsin-like serine protease [Clostridia bacterium]